MICLSLKKQYSKNEMEETIAFVERFGGRIRDDLIGIHEFDDGTGRGIIARGEITKGTVLVQVPIKCLVTLSNLDHLSLGLFPDRDELSETDRLALFLIWAKNHKTIPGFSNYLTVLPKTLDQSMFWSAEELELIRGTDSHLIAGLLKKQTIKDSLLIGVDYEEYQWALGMLWSRCMDFFRPDGSSFRVMAPFADMFNADFDVDVSHQLNTSK